MSNDIAQRQNQLKPFLLSAQKQITSLLQDESKSKRFLAASLIIASDKSLSKCTPESIVQALIGVAMSDLNVDKNIGHCYLVPYGDSVQLQIGYKGFIQLLFRAGWLVKCFPVYKCDTFEMSFNGWDNEVSFSPDIDERDEGDKEWVFENLRGVYVVSRHADTKDEYSVFVSKAVIEKLRLNSPSQRLGKYTKPNDKARLSNGQPIGIWHDWYVEMAQGKAVKKLAKILPIGDVRATTAIYSDDKNESGVSVDYKQTAESGVVIEMETGEIKESAANLDVVLASISRAESKAELESLTGDIEKLADHEKTVIRKKWIDKAAEFKQQKNEAIDWGRRVLDCPDSQEFVSLLKEMPEAEQMKFSDEIDAKFDSFR